IAGRPFFSLLKRNHFGIELGDIHSPLRGSTPASFLPDQPLSKIIARHTVGLSDPLSDEDIQPGDRLNDGLPQSLVACIQTYGLRHFKIKVNGQLAQDTERLHRVAEIIEKHAPPDYAFTLDGNEQFKSFNEFRIFWDALVQSPKLDGFLKHLIFVEQPLHRSE